MPGYETRIRTLHFGTRDFRIRELIDLQQFADPDLHAHARGISSAQWSLFGHVWPAGELLAQAMATFDVQGKRILELGCGLGLASLVLCQRGADITASDLHPLAETFLAYNAALNALPAVPFRTVDWAASNETLGRFDIIIASDVLYERGHAALLSALVERHAHAASEVLLSDPGRGNSTPFTRALHALGFASDETRLPLDADDQPPYRARLLHYHRDTASA